MLKKERLTNEFFNYPVQKIPVKIGLFPLFYFTGLFNGSAMQQSIKHKGRNSSGNPG